MTFKELQEELQNRLSISSSNTFWTNNMLKFWINQANKWACGAHKWPFTEGAKVTYSQAGARYYDYPIEFRSDSVSRLEVKQADGTIKVYRKVRYPDFMNYINTEKNPVDTIFTDYRRWIFINPVINEDGREISVWGQLKPVELVNDGDESPFAEGDENGEEAIIKYALKLALQKGGLYQEATIQGNEATLILAECWSRVQKEQASYQSKDTPFFEVPNFFND